MWVTDLPLRRLRLLWLAEHRLGQCAVLEALRQDPVEVFAPERSEEPHLIEVPLAEGLDLTLAIISASPCRLRIVELRGLAVGFEPESLSKHLKFFAQASGVRERFEYFGQGGHPHRLTGIVSLAQVFASFLPPANKPKSRFLLFWIEHLEVDVLRQLARLGLFMCSKQRRGGRLWQPLLIYALKAQLVAELR